MDDSKENDSSVIVNIQPSTPNRPLSGKNSMNSLNGANKSKGKIGSPSKAEVVSPIRQQKLVTLTQNYNKLERGYADLLLKYNNLLSEYEQIEQELQSKVQTNREQSGTINKYETLLKHIENDHNKNKELYEQEIFYYKELIDDLQLKINKMTNELNSKRLEDEQFDKIDDELLDKYNALLKQFKILQSNYELEQNSKLVLIDQIEYLTKQNDLLNPDAENDIHKSNNNSNASNHCHEFDDSVIHVDTYAHTMNNLSDESDVNNSDLELDEDQDSQILSYLADDMNGQFTSSSPIKRDESLKIANDFVFPNNSSQKDRIPNLEPDLNFKFPASPDPESKELKRQSLPATLKHNSHLDLNDDFILSPLKLTANNTSYFNMDNSINNTTKRRYSNSKPNHSRYNSHDILPIKVEFEPLELTLRSTSGPDKYYNSNTNSTLSQNNNKFESIEELPELIAHTDGKSVRNSTFNKLNGYNNIPSNRSSLNTTGSSKSSLLIDHNIMTNDMTKQEIMKLKFELHSLKLHNEKLLSYIGFELQKQKKNIKKLSHKQSTTSLRNFNRKIEYSDAKLIEKSRDLLIHKKRVLRSVSVNPILSRKYNYDNNVVGILTKSLLPFKIIPGHHEDRFEFTSDFINSIDKDDEDDYGFMKHNDKFNKRVLSNSFEADEIDDDEIFTPRGNHGVKKYKSQIFRNNDYDSSFNTSYYDYDDDNEDHHENYTEEDDNWEDISGDSTISEEVVNTPIFNQLKYLITGSYSTPKKSHARNDSVDDGLKYKFLSIAIGILIIGLRCTNQNHNL